MRNYVERHQEKKFNAGGGRFPCAAIENQYTTSRSRERCLLDSSPERLEALAFHQVEQLECRAARNLVFGPSARRRNPARRVPSPAEVRDLRD